MERLDSIGMDTITLAGPLEARLEAMRAAGFTQVMLSARDLTSHPAGPQAAAAAVRASGLRPTGLQVLRDFEGLDGHLHHYKVEVARAMLELCATVGSKLLLVCSSTSKHASDEPERLARDLRKLALLAVPFGVRVAYEGLSWGRTINEVDAAWDLVQRADCPNLGLCVDSFHMFAAGTAPSVLAGFEADKVFLVQLSDFMWQQAGSFEERITTARTFRVFPGEGVHSAELAALVRTLDGLGYRGDYSFEVFNDDYQQLPLDFVAARARRSAEWLVDDVMRRTAVAVPRHVQG
jgi:sugar phosphate isomerase/epimerase